MLGFLVSSKVLEYGKGTAVSYKCKQRLLASVHQKSWSISGAWRSHQGALGTVLLWFHSTSPQLSSSSWHQVELWERDRGVFCRAAGAADPGHPPDQACTPNPCLSLQWGPWLVTPNFGALFLPSHTALLKPGAYPSCWDLHANSYIFCMPRWAR